MYKVTPAYPGDGFCTVYIIHAELSEHLAAGTGSQQVKRRFQFKLFWEMRNWNLQ
jgi:hypothetical protein